MSDEEEAGQEGVTAQPSAQPEPRKSGNRSCTICLDAGLPEDECSFPSIADLAKHRKAAHPDADKQSRDKAAKTRKETIEQRKLSAMEEEDPVQLIHKLGREGLNRLKKKRLEENLNDVYADVIKPWQRKTAIRKWEMNPQVRDNPQALLYTMIQESRISQDIAVSIAQEVFGVEQEFADVLQQKGIPPILWGATGPNIPSSGPPMILGPYGNPYGAPPPYPYQQQYPQQYPQGQWNQPGGHPGSGYPPPGYQQQGYWPPERPITREEMTNTVTRAVEEAVQKVASREKPEKMITIYEPVLDADGDPIFDDNQKPVGVPIDLPVSAAMTYMVTRRREGAAKAKEGLPDEMKIHMQNMMDKITESQAEIKTLQRTIEDNKLDAVKKENEALRGDIGNLRREVQDAKAFVQTAASSKVVEGYQNDGYRLMGQGLDRVGGALENLTAKWEGPGSGVAKVMGSGKAEALIRAEEGAPSAMEAELAKRGAIR